MERFKLIVAGVLSLLALTLIIQNVDSVETRILFFSFSMPRAFLLFGTFIVGFVAGALWTTSKLSKH